MSDQAGLNSLLKWGIENSATAHEDAPAQQSRSTTRGLDPALLAQLLGGPSDADLMRQSMTAILAPFDEIDLENKLVAWDNFEQLIESIDNANNLEALKMWTPLVQLLDHEESEMRRMAAWCCSTAVQNNIKAQERLLAAGAVPKLARLAQDDEKQNVRKKAIGALSSAVRNFQPAMDELEKHLPQSSGTDASDMEAVDKIIERLRANAATLSA